MSAECDIKTKNKNYLTFRFITVTVTVNEMIFTVLLPNNTVH